MSEAELKEIEADLGHWSTMPGESTIRALAAEVRRLRGLVKSAKWAGYAEVLGGDEGVCPWCCVLMVDGAPGLPPGTHAPDCPAFTPDGEVK
jgi:hypothetical protein